MLWHRIGNFVWASGSGGEEVKSSRKNFSGRERKAKGRVRLPRARGSADLRKVASGSATLGLWLRDRKVESQVSGIDRSRFFGRRTVIKIRREGRRGMRASVRAKKKVHSLGFDLDKREEQVVCHASALALAMTDEARREAEMKAWRLHLFCERQQKPCVFH